MNRVKSTWATGAIPCEQRIDEQRFKRKTEVETDHGGTGVTRVSLHMSVSLVFDVCSFVEKQHALATTSAARVRMVLRKKRKVSTDARED